MTDLIITEETTLAEFDKVTKAIAGLNEEFAGKVYDIETPKGLKDCMADRSKIRKIRTSTERMRKEFKAPLNARSKLIDSQARRIKVAAEELEQPRAEMIKAEEERRARIKAEAEEKERQRIKGIQDIIHQITDTPNRCNGMNSDQINGILNSMAGYDIDESFMEFQQQAIDAMQKATARVTGMFEAVDKQEAADEARRIEDQRLKDERAKLEAEKAEMARMQAEKEANEVKPGPVQEVATDEKKDTPAETKATGPDASVALDNNKQSMVVPEPGNCTNPEEEKETADHLREVLDICNSALTDYMKVKKIKAYIADVIGGDS